MFIHDISPKEVKTYHYSMLLTTPYLLGSANLMTMLRAADEPEDVECIMRHLERHGSHRRVDSYMNVYSKAERKLKRLSLFE